MNNLFPPTFVIHLSAEETAFFRSNPEPRRCWKSNLRYQARQERRDVVLIARDGERLYHAHVAGRALVEPSSSMTAKTFEALSAAVTRAKADLAAAEDRARIVRPR